MSQLDNIFSILEKDEIALWKKKDLPKEGILFKEGEECAEVGIVAEGQLVISSYSYGGKEIVYNLIGPGQLIELKDIFVDGYESQLTPVLLKELMEKAEAKNLDKLKAHRQNSGGRAVCHCKADRVPVRRR